MGFFGALLWSHEAPAWPVGYPHCNTFSFTGFCPVWLQGTAEDPSLQYTAGSIPALVKKNHVKVTLTSPSYHRV